MGKFNINGFIMFLLMMASTVPIVNSSKIELSQTSVVIDKGSSSIITFTINEPIICPQMVSADCSLVILLSNPNTHKISLDNCQIKWKWDEWTEPRFLRVSAVENFINDLPFSGKIITKPAISNSEYYSGFKSLDIDVQTVPRPSATCSGTGDPHYTTFDGAYWHVYWHGTYVFYKSLARDFEVQVQATSCEGCPAQHCGFAAKENNDIVVINACSGNLQMRRTCGSTSCLAGGYPRVSVSGSTYQVLFASGANVALSYYNSMFGNMYATAPGIDYKQTVGICGNFNGNPNDDSPIYQAYSPSQMFANQLPTIDLFNWYPTTMNPPVIQSPYAQECSYIPPVFIVPVLSQNNVEDITNIIQTQMVITTVVNTTQQVFNFSNITTNNVQNQMYNTCNQTISNSNIAKTCMSVLQGFNINYYIDSCIQDLIASNGDVSFIDAAIHDMQTKCISIASSNTSTWQKDINGNPIQPNLQIQNLCPNQCNNNGICNATNCICNNGFVGIDCGININAPFIATSQSDYTCDVSGLNYCSTQVNVYGNNFWNTGNITCKFGNIYTNGYYLGSRQIVCDVPHIVHKGTPELTVNLAISVDNKTWSSTNLNYTYYDGVCQVCNKTTCGINPNSCTINGVCYLGSQLASENICKICNPSVSTTTWTYTYNSPLDCGPQVPPQIGYANIVGNNSAGNVFFKINATNPLTINDPNNKLTYKLINTDPVFGINNNGEIYTTSYLNVNSLQSTFNNYITMQITNSYNNTVTYEIIVNLIKTNVNPTFKYDNYYLSVPENATVGTIIGQITATNNNSGLWASLTYSLLSLDNGRASDFIVNQTTGQISVNMPLNYGVFNRYSCILTARNGGGQYYMTNVQINVTYIPKAPYDIQINNNNVNEKMPIGTVVGVLTSTDEVFTSFKYSMDTKMVNNNFKLIDNKLVTNKTFDYFDQQIYKVSVTSTNPTNLSITKEFTISINFVNTPPYNIRIDNSVFPQNTKVGTYIANVLYDDRSQTDIISCSIVNNGMPFAISNNKLILVNKLNYNIANTYNITIGCIDSDNLVNTTNVIVNITDTPNPASNIILNMIPINENTTIGTIIGNITGTIIDNFSKSMIFTLDDPSYNITNIVCNNITNGVLCTGQIVLTKQVIFGLTPNTVNIIVNTDQTLRTIQQTSINIVDIPKPPTGIFWQYGYHKVQEYSQRYTPIGRLIINDPNIQNNFTIISTKNKYDILKLDDNLFQVYVNDTIKYDYTNPYDNITFIVNDGTFTRYFNENITVTQAPVKAWLNVISNDQIYINDSMPIGTRLADIVLENGKSYDYNSYYEVSDERFIVINNTLILNKNLDNYIDITISFVITVTSPISNSLPSAFKFTANVYYKPIFNANKYDMLVDVDTPGHTTLKTIPQMNITSINNYKLIFSIPTDNNNVNNLFKIDPDTGRIYLTLPPSTLNIPVGKSTLRVGIYDTINYYEKNITVNIINKCYTNPCSPGICQPIYKSYKCICPFDSGDNLLSCNIINVQLASTSNSMASTSLIGIIIGVIVVLIVLIGVVVVVRTRRNRNSINTSNKEIEMMNPMFKAPVINQSFSNPTYMVNMNTPSYDNPSYDNIHTNIVVDGITNPMYDWYKPDFERSEAEKYLKDSEIGTFVIRESKATPGWHILSVNKPDGIYHEKIRQTEENMYEFIENNMKFTDLVTLAEYYKSISNPIYYMQQSTYDNPAIKNDHTRRVLNPSYYIPNDPDAPALPTKQRYINIAWD